MAQSLNDGRYRVWSVPSIANIASVTSGEIAAGTDITDRLTEDGLIGFAPDTAEVPTSTLGSTFDTKLPGRAGFSGTALRFYKETGTDTVYNTLVLNYATNIVIRRDIAKATAVASAQALEVYPGQCGQVKNLDYTKNEMHKYEVPFFISPEPNLRSVVA